MSKQLVIITLALPIALAPATQRNRSCWKDLGKQFRGGTNKHRTVAYTRIHLRLTSIRLVIVDPELAKTSHPRRRKREGLASDA